MVYFIHALIIVSFLDTFSQLPIIAPYAQELGGTSLVIGLVVGMYSLSNMIGNVLAGPWIDRFGRKRIMLWGMGIAGVSLFIYSVVITATQLLWVRFLHGIGGGLLIPAVFAYLGDRAHAEEKGRTMALAGAGVGVAAILGPAFGGVIKQYLGIEWVFTIIALLMLTAALFVKLFLPETFRQQERVSADTAKWMELLNNRHLLNAYLSVFGLMFSQGILAYMLPLKVELIGSGAATTGMLMSVFGLSVICLFVLPTNRLSDKVGRRKPMLAGLLIIAISLALLGVFRLLPVMFMIMVSYGVGFALLFPAVTASVTDHVAEHDRGKAFGLYYAFFSLGVVVGPFFVGWLGVEPDAAMVIGAAVLLALTATLFYRRV